MARRPHRRFDEIHEDLLMQRSVSLAGIIKYQTSRRKTGPWRQMQASDLKEFEEALNADKSNSTTLQRSVVPDIPTSASFDATRMRGGLGRLPWATANEFIPSNPPPIRDSQHDQVFGRLSDTIRLHEQRGQFDGQVVFMAHPNRDVSAHQWSLQTLQWLNIGRYTHSRNKVEGSLASDCLKDNFTSLSTLEFFRLAAEKREKRIVENGRLAETNTPRRPSLALTARIHPATVSSHMTGENLLNSTDKDHSENSPLIEPAISLPVLQNTNLNTTLKQLEDPFVAAVSEMSLQSDAVSALDSHNSVAKGSLNFKFQFPRDQNIGPGRSSQADVRFAREHHSLEMNTHVQHPPTYPPTFTTLSPFSGATVANPHRRGPNPATFQHSYEALRRQQITSGPSAPFVSSVYPPALRYSDPDVFERRKHYEVANGLAQEPPTKQNFSGPFFAASIPTATNPTTPLSVPMSEEEKLVNWFRDGQRPARQQEYTKSLMSAAAPTGKDFGVIGEAKHADGRLDITGALVRLYENLSEYAEEHTGARSRSCFTRTWTG